MYNFKIESSGIISKEFLELNILDLNSACRFVAELPYKRNSDKNNLKCIFEDFGGTCSTKHATLRKLALENNSEKIKLMLGIFKMDSNYAPKIKSTLYKHNLRYIPEAHNYLKIGNEYFDFTQPNAKYSDFKSKIIVETEIEFDEIASKKVEIHRNFLQEWIKENNGYSLEEIWEIREKCIQDLQKNDD